MTRRCSTHSSHSCAAIKMGGTGILKTPVEASVISGIAANQNASSMNATVLTYGSAGRGEFEEHPTTFSVLRDRLEAIRIEYGALLKIPYSVDLVRPGTGIMSVGLGDEEWMLFVYSEDRNLIASAFGDENAEGDVAFFFGDFTELSRKYLIPRDAALEAIQTWWETGKLSTKVGWTDRIF